MPRPRPSMRLARASVLALAGLVVAAGCASSGYRAERGRGEATTGLGPEAGSADRYAGQERQLRRSADLGIRVEDVAASTERVKTVIDGAEGYVVNLSTQGEDSAYVQARVPSASLDTVLERLGGIGDETSRRVTAEDVTDQLIDLRATLENKRELRIRLRALFDRGGKLEDLLRVELELTRVQTEIERLEASLASLERQVALASLTVALERRRVPGPGGVVVDALGSFIRWFFRQPEPGLFSRL